MSDQWLRPLDAGVEDSKVVEIIRLIAAHTGEGSGGPTAAELLSEIEAMEHEDEKSWELKFFNLNRPQRVRIVVFKDDFAGADFSVETTDPVLAKKIADVPLPD